MAAVVYGGSPRHHSRMANTHHIHHSNALQQPTTHHYMSPPSLQSAATSPSQSSSTTKSHHHHQHLLAYTTSTGTGSSPIILPPATYLATGTPMSSSSQPLSLPHPQYAHQPAVMSAATVIQNQYHHTSVMYTIGRHHHKRKSAVELLAESKPFYVKSETVLDRHQQLNFRTTTTTTTLGANSSSGAILPIIGMERANLANVNFAMSPSRTPHTHHGHHRPANRRSASSSSDLLQTKLRKLLNADSKEGPDVVPRYKADRQPQKYDTFSKFQSVKFNQELSVHPSNDHGDLSAMFPSAFLSPQSLQPHPASDEDIYSYGVDEPLVLTEDYRAISPPAEYAAVDSSPEKDPSVRCNYQRSYSHSHDTTSDEPDYSSPSYNINSHKSLPDLHSQISRHSPHSEVLSCCSRGNRSNKSGGGSSLNRDSGGSSGHYTHRSEPCCKQPPPRDTKICTTSSDYRRDSGSSTQHSGNSYYTRYADCPECRAKYQKDSECLLNFTTPEVPEAFQDDHPVDAVLKHGAAGRYYETNRKMYTGGRQPQQPGQEPEISPPPSSFKRQKCLRFKHRTRYSTSNDRGSARCCDSSANDDDRKPILRSKSDISDRYWSRAISLAEQQAQQNKLPGGGRKSESLSQLEKFFDRLGLNDEKFEEIYSLPKMRFSGEHQDSDESSTVFFSDVSTVDSTRLPDSTETQPQTTQPYRPTEPTSIVERNARIIKWLCNCRKLQLV